MPKVSPCSRAKCRQSRCGFTLIEMLLAIGVLTMCLVALGMMARAVEISSEFNQGYGTAALHAQVTFDRISRAVSGASSNANYAGTWVTQDTVGSWTFSDTLVVWHPASGMPANPQGAPLANELVLFCPNPGVPNQLMEITTPADSRAVPSPANASTFKSFIDGLKTESGVQKTQLTDLMRTATDSANTLRGCVRFVVTMNPSDTEISSYRSGTTTWANVPWVQGIWSPNVGMRQVWARTELQLMPAGTWVVTNSRRGNRCHFLGPRPIATRCSHERQAERAARGFDRAGAEHHCHYAGNQLRNYALEFATLRVQQNGNRRTLARQAAMIGLSAGMRKMEESTWAGVGTTVSGNVSSQESYSVTYTTGDPLLTSGSSNYSDYPYRVTVQSTGISVDPNNTQSHATYKMTAVMRFLPRQLATQPTKWSIMQNYTVYQTDNRGFTIDPPCQIAGPLFLQGAVNIGNGSNWTSSIENQYLSDLNSMRLNGFSDNRTLTGPVSLPTSSSNANNLGYLSAGRFHDERCHWLDHHHADAEQFDQLPHLSRRSELQRGHRGDEHFRHDAVSGSSEQSVGDLFQQQFN